MSKGNDSKPSDAGAHNEGPKFFGSSILSKVNLSALRPSSSSSDNGKKSANSKNKPEPGSNQTKSTTQTHQDSNPPGNSHPSPVKKSDSVRPSEHNKVGQDGEGPNEPKAIPVSTYHYEKPDDKKKSATHKTQDPPANIPVPQKPSESQNQNPKGFATSVLSQVGLKPTGSSTKNNQNRVPPKNPEPVETKSQRVLPTSGESTRLPEQVTEAPIPKQAQPLDKKPPTDKNLKQSYEKTPSSANQVPIAPVAKKEFPSLFATSVLSQANFKPSVIPANKDDKRFKKSEPISSSSNPEPSAIQNSQTIVEPVSEKLLQPSTNSATPNKAKPLVPEEEKVKDEETPEKVNTPAPSQTSPDANEPVSKIQRSIDTPQQKITSLEKLAKDANPEKSAPEQTEPETTPDKVLNSAVPDTMDNNSSKSPTNSIKQDEADVSAFEASQPESKTISNEPLIQKEDKLESLVNNSSSKERENTFNEEVHQASDLQPPADKPSDVKYKDTIVPMDLNSGDSSKTEEQLSELGSKISKDTLIPGIDSEADLTEVNKTDTRSGENLLPQASLPEENKPEQQVEKKLLNMGFPDHRINQKEQDSAVQQSTEVPQNKIEPLEKFQASTDNDAMLLKAESSNKTDEKSLEKSNDKVADATTPSKIGNAISNIPMQSKESDSTKKLDPESKPSETSKSDSKNPLEQPSPVENENKDEVQPEPTPSKAVPDPEKPKSQCCSCFKKKSGTNPDNQTKKRCCKCCNCSKKTCLNPLCALIWLVFVIGAALLLHLMLKPCKAVTWKAWSGEDLFLTLALLLSVVFIGFVLLCCIIFLILMKFGVRHKCWGVTKEILFAFHLILGTAVAIFVYVVIQRLKNGSGEKDLSCLKKCLAYVLVMLVLGVIPYVVFSLAYRKSRSQISPVVKNVEGKDSKISSKSPCPCDCGPYLLNRIPFSKPSTRPILPTPAATNYPSSSNHHFQTQNSKVSTYRNVSSRVTNFYRNPYNESQPVEMKQHVFVNILNF